MRGLKLLSDTSIRDRSSGWDSHLSSSAIIDSIACLVLSGRQFSNSFRRFLNRSLDFMTGALAIFQEIGDTSTPFLALNWERSRLWVFE